MLKYIPGEMTSAVMRVVVEFAEVLDRYM